MLIYDYNSELHKYKDVHDEAGGRLKELTFRYGDCFCGSAQYRIVSTTTRHHNHFDTVQCSQCGTLRINPYMTDEAVATYYKEIYGAVKRKDMTAESLFARQAKSADHMHGVVSPLVAKGAAVLDYGAGAGGRMAKLKEAGYDVHIFDYDAHYMAHGVAQGMKAHVEGNRYDMITLSHVIEHVNDPVAAILKFKKNMLKPDGKIYLEVPLLGVRERMLGDFHLAHKYYFTRESLVILGELAGCKTIFAEENLIVITPDANAKPVSEASYEAAYAQSEAMLAKARRDAWKTTMKARFKKAAK